MTVSSNLATEERLSWLVLQLETNGSVDISEAIEHFGVSGMTIRRDLLNLEGLGVARRVRGGAVAVGPVSFEGRQRARGKAKERIAVKLRRLIPANGAIGLDASSTILRLAGLLDNAHELAVITNGHSTFMALQGKPGIHPILTGGRLESSTGNLVGPFATRSASDLLLNRLFLSAAALDDKFGSSETTIENAEIKRVMASVSTDVVVAVDSSKLENRAVAPALDWAGITTLVTELDPKDPRLDPYRGRAEIL